MTAAASQYKAFLDLIDLIHVQAETARYLAISGITLLVYDWLSTLDKEVEYIWGRKWSLARAVYHLNRVLPVLLIGSVLIPHVLFAPAQFSTLTSVQEDHLVIQLRCHHIASHHLHDFNYPLLGTVRSKVRIIFRQSFSKKLTGVEMDPVVQLLIPGLIVTVGHALLQVTLNIERTTVLTNPLPEILQGCLVSIPNDIWLAYFSGVLYELVVFCLIVWRIRELGDGLGLTPLMKQLLKHGVSFFAVNLGLMLFSCVGSAYPSTIIMANGSGLLTALSSIMCSRIFFSMHEFANEDRVHISLGPGLSTGTRGSAIFSGRFNIPMETFSNGSRPPSGLQVTFDTPPQSLGRSVSKGKDAVRAADKLFV
ncbi:unnamed protein product [Rhizoctonia solani]|uniref:DUF6533 domain-containing protein n=1 Tax=Rhizoctonia solani TaxID=456999 RepID=A0A8H3DKN0_9AGAM|nr:unnamed protein product [Rhizoctonia solani]